MSLVVGSGGVLRHATAARARRVLEPATTDLGGGWAVPERARTLVDLRYVLAAAGLLVQEHPEAAAALVIGRPPGLTGAGRLDFRHDEASDDSATEAQRKAVARWPSQHPAWFR